MLFHKTYKRRKDNKLWTRKEVIKKIAEESLSHYKISGTDTLIIATHKNASGIKLKFISSNYAEEDSIELNATVYFYHNGLEQEWVDLFHFTQNYYGKKYRPLVIKKDQLWEDSNVYDETMKVYRTLIQISLDAPMLKSFLLGKNVKYGNAPLVLPNDAHLREFSKKVAKTLFG
ncbi:MAG: hypothetical protein WAQ24_05070 [Candidatus Saccharimonadales bacterium]